MMPSTLYTLNRKGKELSHITTEMRARNLKDLHSQTDISISLIRTRSEGDPFPDARAHYLEAYVPVNYLPISREAS